MLHGFTGTPYEMRLLGESLTRRGYHAVGPRLAGHGTTSEALGQSGEQAWWDSAVQALERLVPTSEAKPIHLLGLSMGAMISLSLARAYPSRIATLTLLAPAARFAGPFQLVFRLFRHRPFRWAVPNLPKGGVGMTDREFASVVPYLDRVPTRLASEVLATVAAGRRAARHLHVPTFVAYGAQDRTVSESGVQALIGSLRPPPLKVVRLARSAHIIPLDLERERLFSEVGEFLEARDDLRG